MNRSIILSLAAFGLFLFSACTKEVDYEPQPQNRITAYKVTNLPDTAIYGAVDNIENTITVYIPFYLAMTVIDPVITLDEGAALSAAAEPVAVTDTTQTYTVKGKDGSTRTYRLLIVQKSAFPLNLVWSSVHGIAPQVLPEGSFSLIGDFGGTSTATLSIAIISRTSGDTLRPNPGQLPSIQLPVSPDLPKAYTLTAYLPVDADSGYYDVEVDYLGQRQMLRQPLHVYYVPPAVAPVWSAITVTQGGDLSFNASSGTLFIDPRSVAATINGITYQLQVQTSTTRKRLFVRLPDNFPTGSYDAALFTFHFGNWPPISAEVPLIVTP
jgi:hypothetical protein